MFRDSSDSCQTNSERVFDELWFDLYRIVENDIWENNFALDKTWQFLS